MFRSSIFAIVFLLGLVGCVGLQSSELTSHTVLHVQTAPGVTVEVLDWGGKGTPLVFLGGGGHTAREFDTFAPLFVDEFRVIGITRRGRGTSSDVPPESTHGLVADIVAVLDSMDFESAVLVGHSFAGVEMALFGEEYGNRCSGLVYLDAAYDYTDPELLRIVVQTPPPQAPPMTRADSSSVAAVRQYFERVSGVTLPEAEILATRQFGADGRLISAIASETLRRQGALQRAPRWEGISCPALGIYPALADSESRIPYLAQLTHEERERAEAYVEAYERWAAMARTAFSRGPNNLTVEFPSGNHYFFLEQPENVVRQIKEFAHELP